MSVSVKLRLHPSPTQTFMDVQADLFLHPKDGGYQPFALSVGTSRPDIDITPNWAEDEAGESPSGYKSSV